MKNKKGNFSNCNILEIYKLGFSLIEIMLGLIVVSVMVAAFAPVVTKKVSFAGVALTTQKTNSIYEKIFVYDASKNGIDGCSLSANKSYLQCPFKVPNGVYAINAVIVSAGGGGGSSSANNDSSVTKTFESTPTNPYLTIQDGMSQILINSLISGGGGGGGGRKLISSTAGASTTTSASPSSEICAHFDALYFDGYCWMKHNIGEIAYLPLNNGSNWNVNGVTVYRNLADNAHDSGASDGLACWYGTSTYKTAASTCTSGINGNYDSCTRTLCQATAAGKLCSIYSYTDNSNYKATGWRQPIHSEWEALLNVIKTETASSHSVSKYMGNSGLQLCDYSSSAKGSDYCNSIDKACKGSIYSGHTARCSPGGLQSDQNNYYPRFLQNGSWTRNSGAAPKYALSGRCITNSITVTTKGADITTYRISGGGSGASGAKISGIVIPESVLKNNIGNKLYIEIGTGGSGGSYSDSNSSGYATSGNSGGTSLIYIKHATTNNITWGVKVLGGTGGRGGYASTSSQSGGSGANSSTTIQYYNTSTNAWATLTSSSQISSNYTKTNSSSGSNGSATSSNSSSISVSAVNGSSIDSYGKGGSGGNATGSGGGYSGGSGKSGYASITYQTKIKGIAGGGGGGGSMIRIENIPVMPNKEITIKVGKGGSGATNYDTTTRNGKNGENGGLSSITYNGKTYSVSGGNGGYGATTTAFGNYGTSPAIESSILSLENLTDSSQGQNGTIGANLPSVNGDGSYGGQGGLSGITKLLYTNTGTYSGLTVGCGGLYDDSTLGCYLYSSKKPDADFSNQTVFLPPNKIYEEGNMEYGSAGAGGGGGGIMLNLSGYIFGKGGSGQNGYVYLWWKT